MGRGNGGSKVFSDDTDRLEFLSILFDEQSYLLELVRYVHLNPVRSGLVKRPEDWRWSGHRAYLGRGKEPFIDIDWVLGILGGTKATARRRYAAFVLEGMGEERRDDFHVGGDEAGVLGDEEFLKRLHFVNAKKKRPVPSLEVVVDAVCESMDLSTAALKAPGRERQASYGRALVGLLSQDLKAASLTEVAAYTGRDVTTLSRAVGILRRRLRDDIGEARKVDSISRKLTRSVEAGNNANTQA